MSRLVGVSRDQLVSRLRDLGFDGPDDGSDHPFMVKGTLRLKVPNKHGRKDIGVELLKRILKQAGLTRREWLGE
jgi:predicted RNA binding protein YcfA (HicA-like mRNA interferase family)